MFDYCEKFNEDLQEIAQLSDEQKDIINNIIGICVSRKKQVAGVNGPAGSGKTFMMKALLKMLDLMGLDYTLAAPTNQAAMILGNATGKTANTIHTILKLRPDLNVIDLDMRDLQFCNPSWQFMTNIIIVDEASMVNKALANFLTDKFKYVIAIYDEAQLRPVKEETKSILISQGTQYSLTKVFRQGEDNPLMKYFPILRKEPIAKFHTDLNNNLGIQVCDSIQDFLIPALKDTKEMLLTRDFMKCRIATFTNERRRGLIDFIRNKIFCNPAQPLVEGEFILFKGGMLCDNMESICNGDVGFVTNISPTVQETCVGDFIALQVEFTTCVGKGRFQIITNENSPKKMFELANEIEGRRLIAVEAKSKRQKDVAWARYKQLVEEIKVMEPLELADGRIVKRPFLDYGYAMTTHSLQGITVDTVYVDIRDINRCKDDEVRQQLQYVALSRTRTKAVLYQ